MPPRENLPGGASLRAHEGAADRQQRYAAKGPPAGRHRRQPTVLRRLPQADRQSADVVAGSARSYPATGADGARHRRGLGTAGRSRMELVSADALPLLLVGGDQDSSPSGPASHSLRSGLRATAELRWCHRSRGDQPSLLPLRTGVIRARDRGQNCWNGCRSTSSLTNRPAPRLAPRRTAICGQTPAAALPLLHRPVRQAACQGDGIMPSAGTVTPSKREQDAKSA